MNTTETIARAKYAFLESATVKITIIICQIIMMSSSLAGLFVNCLILCCIKRQKCLQTYTNATLVNSCVVNIIGCIVLLPLRFALFGNFYDEGEDLIIMCQTTTFFRAFCEIFQLSVLVVISYERYHAVLLPFDKTERVKRVVVLNVVSWCLALMYSSVSTVLFTDSSIYVLCLSQKVDIAESWTHFDSFVIFPFGCLAFSMVLVCYICILRALSKQSNKMLSHSKVKNKVHPIESNIPTASTLEITKSPFNINKQTNDNTKTAINTLSIPEAKSTSNHNAKPTTNSEKVGNGLEHENILTDKIQGLNKTIYLTGITENCSAANYPDNMSIKIEISRVSDTRETENSSKENRNKLSGEKVNKSQTMLNKLEEIKTYEVYDADGTVRVEKNSSDNVAGAVCMFNPKNREHGKRKLEAKIAKNFAIVIGLFGIVWIPLPLFILSKYDIILISEIDFNIMAILSSISLTVYTVNPMITIFMNRKIKSECIKIIKSLNVFAKR